MTEPKPEWQIDAEEAEIDNGDMPHLVRLYLLGRIRALKTELREAEAALGLRQSLPPRTRPH